MEISDQEAVIATLKDPHAFRTLVERYQPALSRYVRRLGCADPDAAKDIVQESFIKAYVKLNDYDPSLGFGSWLYRIAHNEAIDYFRRQQTRPQIAMSDADFHAFEAIADDLHIEKETDAKLQGEAVRAAIEQLPVRYRDILVLRFFEEKSYAEIADILQIPSGTVPTNLGRGKAQLRKILEAHPSGSIYYESDA